METKKQGRHRSTSRLINVRMPNEINERLKETAKRLGVSASQIVIHATREKLEEIDSDLILYSLVFGKE